MNLKQYAMVILGIVIMIAAVVGIATIMVSEAFAQKDE